MHKRDWSRWRLTAVWAAALCAAYSPVYAADHTATSTTTVITDPTNYVIFRHIDSFPEELIPGEQEWNAGGTWGLEIGPRFPAMLGWPVAGRRWPFTVGTVINFAYTNASVIAVDDDGATGPNAPAFWNYYANTRDLPVGPPLQSLLTEAWTQRNSRMLEGEWRIPIDDPDTNVAQQWLLVRQRYTVLRDTLRVEYFVTNDTEGPFDPTLVPPGPNPPGIPLAVGVRTVFDASFGEIQGLVPFAETDGQPVYVTPSQPPVTDDFLFANTPGAGAPPVPEVWQAFQTGKGIGNTGVIVKGTLAGQDVDDRQFADSVAGAPDQLHIGRIATVAADDWQFDFVPSPLSFIGQDWAVAVRWDIPDLPDLQVGETRRFVTYYGLGNATSDFTRTAPGHYVLALQSPLGVEVVQGDDPTTVDVEDYFYTVDALDPAPDGIIPIQAFANNVDQIAVDVGSISVSLPPESGMFFVDAVGDPIPGAGSTITVPVGALPPGTEGSGDLFIRIPAGTSPGVYRIRCFGPGKMVERPISIPAIPVFGVGPAADLARNLQMMSVPYDFVDRDAENILGTLQPAPVDSTVSALGLARYDPTAMRYQFWPNPFILTISPGQGFWVYNPPDAVPLIDVLTLPAPPDRSEVVAPTGFPLLALKGWNQIGTPFTSSGKWNQTMFQVGVAPPVDFATAVSQGLLLPVLFSYDTTTGDYVFDADPDDTVLQPWVGYWLFCNRGTLTDPMTVIFMPPEPIVGRGVPPPAAPRARQVGPQDWRVELVASVPGLTRGGRVVGVAASAAEGYDPGDIMDPPPPNSPEGHLAMFMPHSDWGQLSGRYRWDMRPPITEETTWDVVVQTDRANEQVTLSWPSLRELPKEYGIVLRDLDANVSRSMRTTSVYSYNSGANGGERHLQVVVSAQRPGAPQIAGFQFVPAKGPGGRGDVLFHVNMDCLVDINIRTITGRLVKSLSRGQHFATGQHSVYWDGRNDWGAVVPNGTYLGQIIARTEQGARSSALNRFVVLR